ncbi:MAG: YicC/YloC family endoribonuclease [Gammaproteobacteria bacterium]
MIKSMTGFARCQSKHSFGTLTWELRTVNHRYLDINLRMPDEMRSYENRYRELINAHLGRGKLEGGLRFKPEIAIENGIEINDVFAKSLIKACQRINDFLHQPSEINAVEILQWPGIVKETALDMKPVLDASVELLESALKELVENREREGERLHQLVMQRCKGMQDQVEQVRIQMPEIRQLHREKLMARLAELKADPDMDRLEQELVYIAQKMDVDEEIDRLECHIKELCHVLERDEAVGRRLDFLMQELNREANTLGSKSADIRTTQVSVELKVLIEQMREQVQNIE